VRYGAAGDVATGTEPASGDTGSPGDTSNDGSWASADEPGYGPCIGVHAPCTSIGRAGSMSGARTGGATTDPSPAVSCQDNTTLGTGSVDK
jgi:hypothetical protein